MGVFDHPDFDSHEGVHHFYDEHTGLRGIIAVHSTRLGPAAGGCRLWAYANPEDALTDVLRLSRGMTYKNALAGLPFGGGKAVILKGLNTPDAKVFRAFGRQVDALGGTYVTAEDVGVTVADMRHVAEETPFVSGINSDGGGDPSPWTALGVFLSIEAAVRIRLGRPSLKGVTVAVQGIGNVGFQLCQLLYQAGAKLLVADVNPANVQAALDQFGATRVAPEDVLFVETDVLAPCALGGVLNANTIERIHAAVIAGAANNQLDQPEDGDRLAARNILYAPDYAINAGGIISVAREYLGQYSGDKIRKEIEEIPRRLTKIFSIAKSQEISTQLAADHMAQRMVASSPDERTDPAPRRRA